MVSVESVVTELSVVAVLSTVFIVSAVLAVFVASLVLYTTPTTRVFVQLQFVMGGYIYLLKTRLFWEFGSVLNSILWSIHQLMLLRCFHNLTYTV